MTFSQKVWNTCKKIPKGKVSTYKEIANALNTKAYRVVGNALNKNPFSPKVPCHRVVNSDGRVGGFSKGENAKIRMLRKEGIKIRNKKVADFENALFDFSE